MVPKENGLWPREPMVLGLPNPTQVSKKFPFQGICMFAGPHVIKFFKAFCDAWLGSTLVKSPIMATPETYMISLRQHKSVSF